MTSFGLRALIGTLLCGTALNMLPAQNAPLSPERAAARAWREQHEGAILTEFADFVAIPNLSSDSANIHRNAEYLLTMLAKRGFTNRQLLTLPGVAPAVYAELPAPGATYADFVCAL
jgi:hypothetical protein